MNVIVNAKIKTGVIYTTIEDLRAFNHSMLNFGLFFFFRPNELNFCMWSPI